MPLKSDIKPKYSIGEKLLCYHGPLLYEAKCIEIQESSEIRYLIHYQGWNKTWDEWVNDTRILKFNEAGIKKQKELQDLYKESRKKKDNRKKMINEKRKSSRSSQDKIRFMGSASETSNRSFGESEDGKASKITTEDENLENKTDAGTSVVSEELLDDQKSSIKDKSVSSKTRTRKRRLSNSEISVDKSLVTEEKSTIEDISLTNNEATNSNKSTNSSKSKKSRLVPLDETVLDLDTYVTGINVQSLKFVFTENLRLWLADDWDLITRQSRLSRLPTRMSVDDVLARYKSHCECLRMEEGDNEGFFNKNRDMRFEFVEGMRKYFNTSIGSLLLYKFERQQYFEVVNTNESKKDMSSIYGSMYLLRLLVNIKKLISYTRTDVPSIDCLGDLIQHFIEFLDNNVDEFFKLEDYITATADYTRRAMC
uniref:MRG-1 n=1 Tax=Schmidtea mediterranea TaxID=79327 RepID=H9CXT0_SCHMD|nr:MRG-1 [Schmidtea mediterranea]